ncbi:Zn-dependent hydrolase [Prauserella cavernicola]|uniref:Zn-dependent hydrolase n=1 Tax=Prauserella cavernicola TaxID=2800127 RepID=A0A934QYF0_9PSEU|nr:Zn-dependent hydrolase [Prauserella cavernicola]MBK1787568.1 Zn-dependent hydrolase [Prauserella cavernicola]
MSGLVADPARLRELLDTFAGMSERDSGPGVTRLAYTPLERAAHELFAQSMTALGLTVWTDAAGNTIAQRPGSDPGLPAIGTGSHLDSVPNAGSFDGIVGVCAAMETARALAEHEVTHRHPMRFVVFAAEEGARFGQACTGSRIAAGLTGPADLPAKQDADGVSLADAMNAVGLDPDAVAEAGWRPADWAAFVELHIEQGSVLETDGVRLGVVDSISGSTRLLLELSGRASHSGGTPMHLRADAMAAAAEVVLAVESAAGGEDNAGTRTTVGKIDVAPGSITTIAGRATMWVDVRGTDAGRQRDTAEEIVRRAEAICARRGIAFRHDLLADTPPVRLPDIVRDELAAACRSVGVEPRVLTSGASHDAQQINTITPSGMLFVPSKEGISHDPAEWTSIDDIALGTTALTASLLRLDEGLS